MGAEGGEIATERAKAWDYYLSKEFGTEIEGQSQVVTSDVADVVDSIMPSLLRIFTTADNLVSFDPVGPEDIQKAEQESDYVNYVLFKQNPAFEILYTWFFDALVQKNGIVKSWWDESEVISTETYSGLTQNELFQLLEDEELEPLERSERTEYIVDPVSGMETPIQVHDVEFRRVCKSGKVSVENVPPEEYRISSDARSLNPSKARMVGHERLVKRSDLRDMGFDANTVDSLPEYSAGVQNSSEHNARYDKTDDTTGSGGDRSQDEILLREAYIKVDFDGDGRAELRQVITAGHEILSNEPVDRQPFHVISPQPLPHKHFGRASAEKVMDVQEISSELLRQILDNLYHTNRPGKNVWEQAIGDDTMDDLLTTRVGRIARFTRPVTEAVSHDIVPFTAASSFPMVEYFDKVKRDRTGVSADSEGLNPDSLKNIQQSVLNSATDLGKMKIEAVARIFAETGIKSLLLHIHELCLKHQDKSKMVQLRNEWVEIDPTSWRTRFDMTVKIGLGIGTREQNLMHLTSIWDKQMALMQMGGAGTLVTPQNLFNTAAEMVKNANLKDPNMFFSQAESFQQQNDPAQQQQMALVQRQQELDAQDLQLKQQKMMQDMAQFQQQMEQKEQERQDKFAVEMEKISNDLTKMELDSGQDLPGSKATSGDSGQNDIAKVAKARKDMAEAEAQEIENDMAKSGIKNLVEQINNGPTSEPS